MGLRVRVIASTISYGSNGFKHAGDEFSLPDDQAKEKAAAGLVKIIPSLPKRKKKVAPAAVKEEKAVTVSPEVKEALKST